MFFLSKLLVISCLLAFGTTEGIIRLTATQTRIDLFSTKTFGLTCAYEGNEKVLSLQLSKFYNLGIFVPTLKHFVTMDKNSKIRILSPSPYVKYKGGIDGKGKANLCAKWSRVPVNICGFYRCKVQVVDRKGHAHSLVRRIRIETKRITLVRTLAAIKELQRSEQRYRKALQTSEQRYLKAVRPLSSKVSRIQKWNGWISYTFKLLEWGYLKADESMNYNGRYYVAYKHSPGVVRYAEGYCRIRGGYLAEVNDLREWRSVASFLKSVGGSQKGFFVSGRRKNSNSKSFYWPSIGKKKSAYFNWNRRQPDNHSGGENCVALYRSFRWRANDVKCYDLNSYGFICELLWSERTL